MGRSNNADAIAGYVAGLREAKAAFQALPEITRDAMLGATETTLSEVVRAARAKLQSSPSIRTRALYNQIGYTLNKNSGRGRAGIMAGTTTFVSGGRKIRIKGIFRKNADGTWNSKKVQPSRYGPKVEFGTKFMTAEPFMIPAAESQEQPYLDRCQAAGRKIETAAAAIGGGRL
jgi:hypothetical protein